MRNPFDEFNTEETVRKALRISQMRWDEISGVDHPANQTPGWLLRKSEGADAVAEIRDALAEEVGPIVTVVTDLERRLDRLEGRR